MAGLDGLINRIEDVTLREMIREEVKRANKQKKFGLVFEQHLPEATPLYDLPVKKGSLAAIKEKSITEIYFVESIADGQATCIQKSNKEKIVIPVDELVVVAQFGDPIYPYLRPLDSVCNAPNSDLWHTLIEADNYHALQLLAYLYAGKVDCIYIDPPYNTGARDWKYNNDYVDGNDNYRHSKWLSFMEKRLLLAKKLLNPANSVLIITIDEKEYHHLRCLLEELFADASIQMITDVTSPRAGASRDNEFSRSEEYIFIVQFGDSSVGRYSLTGVENDEKKENSSPIWFSLLRTGNHSSRRERPNLFYPIWVNQNGRLHSIGESVPLNQHCNDLVPPEEDLICLLPTRPNGDENTWNLSADTLRAAFDEGTARIRFSSNRFVVSYLRRAEKRRIENGELELYGRDEDGSWLIRKNENVKRVTTTKSVWVTPAHDAGLHGTLLIKSILGNKRFDFPKSLYAVCDTIKFFITDKPNALVVDFFAGSGTTLHAVNLINSLDNGQRRCIMVTNNEVSADEGKRLTEDGLRPGDTEWDRLGIARYVTWPRTVCSIEGHDVNGEPLKGEYLGGDPDHPRAMSEGFAANAIFFRLGFLDKTAVALGRQFKEMLPLLWMKAGARGPCPSLEDDEPPEMLILPENQFAVLTEEALYEDFVRKVNADRKIKTIFIVTDSEPGYREMVSGLRVKNTYQLYRDYLDNFRINQGRR